MHDRKKTLTCCYAREVGARGFHEASFASQRSSRSSRNASSMRRLMSCARLVIADDDAKHLERIALIRKQLPAVSDDVTAKRPYLKDLVAKLGSRELSRIERKIAGREAAPATSSSSTRRTRRGGSGGQAHAFLFVAVNRAGPGARTLAAARPGEPSDEFALAPELPATWYRLTEGPSQARPRVTLTAARNALAAVRVLRPAGSRLEAAPPRSP